MKFIQQNVKSADLLEVADKQRVKKGISLKDINSSTDKNNVIEGKRNRKPADFNTFLESFAAAKKMVMQDKIHRKDLPVPLRNHWEVLQHQYSARTKAAEVKEFNTLFEKDLCKNISRREAKKMKDKGIIESGAKPLPLSCGFIRTSSMQMDTCYPLKQDSLRGEIYKIHLKKHMQQH